MRRSTRSAALQWCAIALSVILIGMPTHRARAADPGEDAPAKPDAPKFDPTDAYDVSQVQGWTVRVNKKLGASDPALRDQVMELLHLHLYQVTRVVPKTAVEKLKTVVIWVELDDPKVKGMCYHPNADWLAKNGLNPEKVHGVEAGNAKNFIGWWHEQPWMVLHELAHAYHDQCLENGFDNTGVKGAYERAKKAGLYDHVQRINGREEKAYAMNNQMEFFAECSEAFFGTNDFYPFVRSELKQHDPEDL